MPTPASFQSTFASVADVEGWMSEGQARLLWDRASALGDGDLVVEIGSYHGRSAIVLATAAPAGAEVVAIDPHAGNDRGPQQIVGPAEEGQRDHETYLANLRRAGVADRVRHVRLPSQEAGGSVDRPIQLLYIDGAHRFAPARADIVDWGNRVAEGGTLLIHDSFSSVGVTLAIATTLLAGGRFRYVDRSRSMAEYRREDLSPTGRATNALRQVAQVPWFARNVAIKVLIVARLGRLTRLLGHRDPTWPY
ncbi:MAG TPA: class I SAM-dependent methyltransferase [Acidimicrobiales bacterium]|nr:class I SAM-dependent methyltransferase [Acidimicrobiales bacterium]